MANSVLGHHLRAVRLQLGLSVVELARLCGYRNTSKGCRRIVTCETTGVVHPELLAALAAQLEVSDDTIRDLAGEDCRLYLKRWAEWVNEPVKPYIIIRLLPAIYQRIQVPQEAITLEEAEALASAHAIRSSRSCCLVWSRRLSIWIDADGSVYSRKEAVPGELNCPSIRLKGNKRTFVMGDDKFTPQLLDQPPTKGKQDGD